MEHAMTELDDLTFLAELIRQRDTADLSAPVNGQSVATALGHPDVDTEAMVRRLIARGYIEKSTRTGGLGDTAHHWDLNVTPAGYAKLGA
jgi:hypothetical protein